MALKKTDYTVNLGIQKKTYRRGVEINGIKANIDVVLALNHNKGLVSIERKLSDRLVADDNTEWENIQTVYDELETQARKDGVKWRDEWKKARKEDEEQGGRPAKNQIDLPLG